MTRDVTQVMVNHARHVPYPFEDSVRATQRVENEYDFRRRALDVMTQQESHVLITCDGIVVRRCITIVSVKCACRA